MKTKLILFALIGFLTVFEARAASYVKGDKVEAFWHGGWYKAEIERIEGENLYRVHFQGYWSSREELFPPDLIRPIPDRNYPEASSLKEGDALEFLEKDHWRPAVFLQMQKSKAWIRYTDQKKRREKSISLKYLWKPSENPQE
jgi:hypothetical protein